MNIVDLIIIAVIAITVISGLYRGFLSSLLITICMVISWVIAYATYPLLTSQLLSNGGIMNTLFYYTDAASRLGTGVARTLVGQAGGQTIESALSGMQLPQGLGALFQHNIATQAFSSLGLSTVGDYLNQTIITVVLSVVCFLALFIVCFVVFNVLINLIDHVVKFPSLRHCNALAGGALGFVRGVILLYLVFSLVPILITALPVQAVTDYISASRFGSFFAEHSFITTLISAVR